MKVSIIPWIVRKLKLCFALVEDGDTASQNIAQGKFVIWKGVCCKAASAITAGETLSGTNLPAISSGALNDISDSIPDVVNNLTSDSATSALSAAQGKALNSKIMTKDQTPKAIELNDLDNGIAVYSASSQNIPSSGHGGTILTLRNNYNSQGMQIAQANAMGGFYYRNILNDAWGEWNPLNCKIIYFEIGAGGSKSFATKSSERGVLIGIRNYDVLVGYTHGAGTIMGYKTNTNISTSTGQGTNYGLFVTNNGQYTFGGFWIQA